MVKENIKFTLNGTPQTFSGTQDIKKQTTWQWLLGKKPDGWEQPSELFLVVRVKKQNVTGKGDVSALRIELVANGSTENDVLYEKLIDNESVGKDFIIMDVDLDQTTYQEAIEYLSIPRTVYYNIKTQFRSEKLENTPHTPWIIPTDDQIDAITTEADYNVLARQYNEEIDNNPTIQQFFYLVSLTNSTSTFYEIEKEKNYNNYINNTMDKELKVAVTNKGLTKEWPIRNTINSWNSPDSYAGLAQAKQSFKRQTGKLRTLLPLMEQEIKKIRGWISAWKQAGNLTDSEYNDMVENWNKVWNENDIVKKYNELSAKVGGGDAKYQKYQSQFNTESSKEVSPGVAANKELVDLGTPTKIAEGDVDSISSHDTKKVLKYNFKTMRELKDKILVRKQAVIDLIEGLVASDTGGGSKLTCPNCNQKFDALPFEYNGKKYHSQQCMDEAKRKEQGGGGSDQNQGAAQAQTAAIQAINDALNQDPKISTNDLDSDFQNWENQIKGFSEVKNINNFKDKVITNITKKRNEKKSEREAKERTKNIENETGSNLIDKIKNAEDLDGSKSYENERERVDRAIDKAFQENPENTKELIKDIVEAKMTKCGVSEDELGAEEKGLFAKIKNKEIDDKEQLKNAKKTLVEFIGNKEVEKKINSLQKEVEAARSLDQKEAVKKKLNDLLGKDDIYVEKRKSDIQNLLEKLESNTNNDTTDNKPGIPWKVILPIAIVAIVLIVGAALVARKRKKQKEIRELED